MHEHWNADKFFVARKRHTWLFSPVCRPFRSLGAPRTSAHPIPFAPPDLSPGWKPKELAENEFFWNYILRAVIHSSVRKGQPSQLASSIASNFPRRTPERAPFLFASAFKTQRSKHSFSFAVLPLLLRTRTTERITLVKPFWNFILSKIYFGYSLTQEGSIFRLHQLRRINFSYYL